MTKLLLRHLLLLCFSEMLLVATSSAEHCGPPFIRVLMKYQSYNGFRFYTGAISLGTPPQTFNVFIDTSSADIAIRSSASLSPSSSVNPVYDSKKSSTYKKNDTLANVTNAHSNYVEYIFGDYPQFGKGFLSADTLKIAGVTVKQQLFVEMKSFGPLMKIYGSVTDGMLGLAYPLASNSGAVPFFQNMLQQGIISNPIFALTFNNISSDFELTLGGMDSNKFRGLPTWTPVTEKRYWKFSVAHLLVRYSPCNITRVSCNNPMGCQMVIDSMSEDITGSYEVLSRVGPLIGTNLYTGYQGVPCSLINSLPDIGFNIGGNDFYMTPAQYMIQGALEKCRSNDGTTKFAFTTFFSWTPKDKFNNNSEVWILGTRFLRTVNTVFDFGNNRIGFHPQLN